MFGVYQTHYTSSLPSSSASAISWIGSIQAFLLFLVGTLVGPIYDVGHVRSLLVVGSFLSVFGLSMTSICKEYWQLVLAQGILTGTGFGCLFLPGCTIVSQYFSSKKAFATGIASLGSSIGTFGNKNLGFHSSLTRDRWRHIPYHLHATRASDWSWLGDPYYCAHSPFHPDYTASCCSTTEVLNKATLFTGPFCAP